MNLNQKYAQMVEQDQNLHTADISIMTPQKSAFLFGNDQTNKHEQAALLTGKNSHKQPVDAEKKGPVVMKLIQTPDGFVPVVIDDQDEDGWCYAKRLASFQQKLACAALL